MCDLEFVLDNIAEEVELLCGCIVVRQPTGRIAVGVWFPHHGEIRSKFEDRMRRAAVV